MGDETAEGDGEAEVFSCAATDAAEDNEGVCADTDAVVVVLGATVTAGTDIAVVEADADCADVEVPFDSDAPRLPAGAAGDINEEPFVDEPATAAMAEYRIGGNAGFDPAVPGAPVSGNPDLRACDIGWATKFGAGGNIGGGAFEESSVASERL
jgi:hypothetical protein